MELLAIVQALHHEAKQPGSPPDTVTGQTGRAADFVRWAIAAYNDIQRDKNGRWKWLLSDWHFNTEADTASYAYGAVTDTDAAAVITRFRAWDIDPENPPHIYLVSDGEATERELPMAVWDRFRRTYLQGTHTAAEPTLLSIDPRDKLFFGPTPDAIYKVSGSYWKSNQVLANDSDTPEMPADYHEMIVYRALVKYAYNVVAQETLAHANEEGTALLEGLIGNQWYGNFRLRWPDALA